MKKFLLWLITVIALLFVLFNKEKIFKYIMVNIVYSKEFVLKEKNEYHSDFKFEYVTETDNFTPKNKQELINIFYTVLNSGWDKFSFVCSYDYNDCVDDVQDIMNDPLILPSLNNYVHPFNSYDEILINANSFGRIDITIDKVYSDLEISIINTIKKDILNKYINDTMSNYEKVKTLHDYIINNTKYDSAHNFALSKDNKNNTAYGLLLNGTAICGGYADIMSLLLYDLGIPNYRISSEEHIWNYLYIDGSWKHLDLTWDDPVTSNGEDLLLYKFFLISTSDLENLNIEDHLYEKSIYLEAK